MSAVIAPPRPEQGALSARLRVSVVVKALDEERHIRGALESALAALAAIDGEVILADSGSTDRTVEIAREYPVTVVQLANRAERRCGIGPQLGYQHARGEYVYILDGDMELDAAFLAAAVAALDREPELAGVAGLVEEQSEASWQFRGRKRRAREGVARNDCEWLDMGGLYRAAALRDVGYFSNRNLHAFEEMELGLRLCAAGWRLRRLPVRSVLHHGRPEPTGALLRRRWRTRYLDGAGELLRACLGRPYFYRALQTQQHLCVALGIWAACVASLAALPWTPWPLLGTCAALLALIAVQAVRRGSFRDALAGQWVWQVGALAMLRGLLVRPRDPRTPVASLVLHVPEAAVPPADSLRGAEFVGATAAAGAAKGACCRESPTQ